MERDLDLRELLPYIDPAALSYQDWCNVGMALKHEGYSCDVWDDWSRADSRYHAGECRKKWETFRGSASPVTGGTIVQMAKERGWRPASDQGHELDWDAEIGGREVGVIVKDPGWIEQQDIQEPEHWEPVRELIRYLEALFDSTDNVGYVTKSFVRDGKHMPTKGNYDRTAGELIQALQSCGGDIGAVLGDYDQDTGAWIRFNPLDGKGIRNENVTDYRFALVESDRMDLATQNAMIRELELPVAALVYSGKKSIHAIVRIEAATYEEYRKRVDYLYTVLKKNGFECDTQNKNPSRLSRMPGVMRGQHKQFLIDTNIGKPSWAEWKEWIEASTDDLPDADNLASVWNDLPPLAPPLIEGILRQGHKLLLAGPSKAGKSYALIELCVAIAEGRSWLGWPCAKGQVMYVNLELDKASCLHRFADIYQAMGLEPRGISNIDIWNLRGRSVPMDKLAPKLIRRAQKRQYIAIVIDPIYKVITGDENSADQMAAFCNQFDRVATELGCAVIYCHHHSKGSQGQKRSVDRASGSGVFARDPDALLDMIELDVTDQVYAKEEERAVCALCLGALHYYLPGRWQELYSQEDAASSARMLEICRHNLAGSSLTDLTAQIEAAKHQVRSLTAWRIDGTFREFPKQPIKNLWFDFPLHREDKTGALEELTSDDGFTRKGSPWRTNFSRKKTAKEREQERKDALKTAFEACRIDGDVTVKAMAEYMGVSEKTVQRRIDESSDFWRDGSEIGLK